MDNFKVVRELLESIVGKDRVQKLEDAARREKLQEVCTAILAMACVINPEGNFSFDLPEMSGLKSEMDKKLEELKSRLGVSGNAVRAGRDADAAILRIVMEGVGKILDIAEGKLAAKPAKSGDTPEAPKAPLDRAVQTVGFGEVATLTINFVHVSVKNTGDRPATLTVYTDGKFEFLYESGELAPFQILSYFNPLEGKA